MPGMMNVAIPATAQPPFDSQLSTFWRAHKLTGDNSLERPYSHLYPRLTTRSNTYTVHLRVQSIRQTASADPTSFREGRDVVNGDFRGAFIIERYLDPNLQEFKNDNDQLGPYRFRVVSSKQFAL